MVLLAPSASALRKMLDMCDTYANTHDLIFNAAKTQLICFLKCHECSLPVIHFNNMLLKFTDEVIHLVIF